MADSAQVTPFSMIRGRGVLEELRREADTLPHGTHPGQVWKAYQRVADLARVLTCLYAYRNVPEITEEEREGYLGRLDELLANPHQNLLA